MIARVLRDANIDLGSSPGFSVTMVQVYPVDTPLKRMLDPDNIAVKKLIDCIAQAIGHDDGGVAMKLKMLNIVCDSVPEGMYTIISPRTPAEDILKYQNKIKEALYGADKTRTEINRDGSSQRNN